MDEELHVFTNIDADDNAEKILCAHVTEVGPLGPLAGLLGDQPVPTALVGWRDEVVERMRRIARGLVILRPGFEVRHYTFRREALVEVIRDPEALARESETPETEQFAGTVH